MGNSKSIFIAFGSVIVIAGVLWITIFSHKSSPQTNSTAVPTSTPKAQVPLPQETDIIRLFFNVIGEHRAADAVGMLTPHEIGNDTQKQSWAVMFNAFKSINVTNIEDSMPEEWTSGRHTYKVTLDVKMKPEAASVTIPYYGYDNGTNIRFITLEKINNFWKIDGIATSP